MLASSCSMPLSSGELLLPSVNRLCLTSTQSEDSSGGAEKSEVDMVSLISESANYNYFVCMYVTIEAAGVVQTG